MPRSMSMPPRYMTLPRTHIRFTVFTVTMTIIMMILVMRCNHPKYCSLLFFVRCNAL